jgi:sulfatase maturation enzyme AslB (radical SAM superfamily)
MSDNKIFKFEVHLTDHCNLNCKCCEHFSPLADTVFVPLEELERDFKSVSKIVTANQKVNIYLLGGEPLLHTEIISILLLARGCFPHKENIVIRLVTNGILLMSKTQEFWDCCRDNSIVIAPTMYPINVDYKAIEKKCISNQVQFEIFHTTETKYLRLVPITTNGVIDPQDSFNKCPISHRCSYVKNGKLYSCPRIPNIHYFNKAFNLNLETTNEDYIDLDKIADINDVWSFLNSSNHFCKYCDVNNTRTDILWEHSKKDITEWSN